MQERLRQSYQGHEVNPLGNGIDDEEDYGNENGFDENEHDQQKSKSNSKSKSYKEQHNEVTEEFSKDLNNAIRES